MALTIAEIAQGMLALRVCNGSVPVPQVRCVTARASRLERRVPRNPIRRHDYAIIGGLPTHYGKHFIDRIPANGGSRCTRIPRQVGYFYPLNQQSPETVGARTQN
jgi:hypothetical protein